MKPRLILFDVDGTLVDTAGAERKAVERAFAEVFGADDLDGAAGVAYAGRTDPVILEAIAEALGSAPSAPSAPAGPGGPVWANAMFSEKTPIEDPTIIVKDKVKRNFTLLNTNSNVLKYLFFSYYMIIIFDNIH